MITTIKLRLLTGTFAENKDIAREIRTSTILPALQEGKSIIIDFTGVEGATQSFIHALISEVLQTRGGEALDHITFKHCNTTIQKIITIVTEYLQETR